jgi:Xaa-Pro dipeptidase
MSAGVAGASALIAGEVDAKSRIDVARIPEPIRQLKPLAGKAAPITDDERRARIEKAQRLMAENHIDAVYLESGSSLFYYTGVRWGNSERMFGAVIPARGEIAWITPKFEEARARELIRFGKDIRAWEEDESPYKVVAGIFKDRGVRTGRD